MSNKVALVTGASAGFGKAIVTKLIEDGYRIIATPITNPLFSNSTRLMMI